MLITILSFILVLSVVVIPHELGHLLFALRAGIRPLEFGIGFPPKLFSIKRWKTVFSINAIPIGGFVRVAGMNPESEGKEDKYPSNESYLSKGPFDRALTILGGPLMNFLFAFLILTFAFLIFGSPTGVSNEIGSVIPGSEAERIGLKPGDKILAINGIKIINMEDAISIIHKNSGKKLLLKVIINDEVSTIYATPQYNKEYKVGLLGFSPRPIYTRHGILTSIWLGARQTFGMMALIFVFLGMLFTGKASLSHIAGPVGIAQITGQAAHGGILSLFSFMAFFSVNLGIINLLPFPALDGGRVLFIIIEAIRRKPVSQEVENRVHLAGIVILFSLLFFLTINDILRLFR